MRTQLLRTFWELGDMDSGSSRDNTSHVLKIFLYIL